MPPPPPAGQQAWAQALLDARLPPPAGLRAWNGSDPGPRFAVHRNNVVASLVAALADSFPVLQALVGEVFFSAMARCHLAALPPRSPVLAGYGDDLADWLVQFAPAQSLPYLPDMARLERARVRATHAADAEPVSAALLAQRVAQPLQLPLSRLLLHPSVVLLRSPHAVVSLWAAHQGQGRIEDVDPGQAEQALVLRTPGDVVLVLPLAAAAACFLQGLLGGQTLGDATAMASATASATAATGQPGFDLAGCLGLLIQHGAIVGWPLPAEPPGAAAAV